MARGALERAAVPTPPPLARRLCRGLSAGRRPLLDPACGEGELLLAALEQAGSERASAARALHGIEIDPERARRARERLLAAIGGEAGRRAAARVVVGDALDPALSWPAGAAIVANPPWGSLSGRQATRLPPERLALYRRTYRGLAGWPSLHGAFLERISRAVLEAGTRARVLLPASVCELERYGPLRRVVSAAVELSGPPRELGEDAFEGVTEPAVLLDLRARERAGRGSDCAWTTAPEEAAGLLEHLAAFPRLPPEAFGDPGVHTGNAARELLVDGTGGGLPGLREGRDLRPYRLDPPRRSLCVDLAPRPGRRFRIAPRERYARVPVLLRQTADRPMAALHDPPGYFRNSLLACRPPPELDPAFAVAVLNGPVARAWHRLSFRDARQRAFPQVKVGHLRTQPFPLARRGEDPRLHDEVVRLVRGLARDPPSGALARIDALVLRAFGLRRQDARCS